MDQESPSRSAGEMSGTIRGENKVVQTAQLRPSKWNYNVLPPAVFNKLVRSISDNGFVQPVVVRTIGKGLYEIINGEHRWRAAIELGMKEIPIVDLGKIDDVKAKSLAIILNELGGSPDQVRLADLLRDISVETPFEELVSTMPFPESELKMFLESVDFSFATLSGEDVQPPASKDEDEDDEKDGEGNTSPRLLLHFKSEKQKDELQAMLRTKALKGEALGTTALRLLGAKGGKTWRSPNGSKSTRGTGSNGTKENAGRTTDTTTPSRSRSRGKPLTKSGESSTSA